MPYAPRSANPAATVVVPTLDGGARFRSLLSRIAEQDTDVPFELLVVDSGSMDGSAESAEAMGARVRRIDRKDFNHGLTRNHAIAESRGEIVALLTQDAVPVGAGWLQPLLERFRSDPRVAGVYSRQVPRPGCNPLLRLRLEGWAAGKPDPCVQEPCSEDEWAALDPVARLFRIAFDDVASAVRKSVWHAHPYEKRSFGEDLAWGKSVIRAGYRIAYEPRSVVEHSHDMRPLYELRRLYADHDNLRALVGLALVPDLATLRRQLLRGPAWYAGRVRDDARLTALEKAFWVPGAALFCWAEVLGQYLGYRSEELRSRSAAFRSVDRLLRRGI
jgi:rhamnosyltransferase